MQKITGRNRSIDALRGMAAVMVMILHIGLFFGALDSGSGQGEMLENFFKHFDLGRMGITVFFIISGFVIPKSIKENKSRPVKRFIIKRFFRLYPLFWFSMISGLFFIWYLNDRLIDFSLILANVTMIPAFFSESFIIGLYWTLETELIFYILTIVLLLMGILRKLQIFVILTLLLFFILFIFQIYPAVSPDLPHWEATPYHLSLMFLGVIFRHYFDQDRWTWTWNKLQMNVKQFFIAQLLLVLSIPVFVLLQFIAKGSSEHVPDAVAYLIGIGLFFLVVRHWRNPPRFVVYLGLISYSIYLMHPVVFHFINYLIGQNNEGKGMHMGVYIFVSVLLTILVSHLSYQYIEHPFNRYGHRKAKNI